MKRERKLQISILRRIEEDENAAVKFEEPSQNQFGYNERSTPDWSDEESYNINLMIRDGFLRMSELSDSPHLGGLPDDPYAETYLHLTTAGHDWLENSNLIVAGYRNIRTNLATLVASVLTALAIAYGLNIFGPDAGSMIGADDSVKNDEHLADAQQS